MIDLVARAKEPFPLEGIGKRAKSVVGNYRRVSQTAYKVALRDVEKWLRELGSIERADDIKRILKEIENG